MQVNRDSKLLRSRILSVLQEHNGLTISDVSRFLGIHYTTASKYLAVMEAQNLVKHRQIGMAKLFLVNGVIE
jgi:predicted ArsR family transcriptional regulator